MADRCPACAGPMPPAAPTGRPRKWCKPRCRYLARGRPPAVVRKEQQALDAERDEMNSVFPKQEDE
jgi:hypothetical protein